MSKLPFVALFNYLVGVIAPEFFDTGLPCLETGNRFLSRSLFLNSCRLFLFSVVLLCGAFAIRLVGC